MKNLKPYLWIISSLSYPGLLVVLANTKMEPG